MKKLIATVLLTLALTLPAAADSTRVNYKSASIQADLSQGVAQAYFTDYMRLVYNTSPTWDGVAACATVKGTNVSVSAVEMAVRVGERVVYSPYIKNVGGRISVPVRLISELLGNSVAWNGEVSVTKGAIPSYSYNEEDLYWLSRIIEAESAGEPFSGKVAVGNVVLERVKSGEFPDSVRSVIFDTTYSVQFTPVSNGTIYNAPSQESIDAAKQCLEGRESVSNCLYFVNPAKSPSSWIAANRKLCVSIGSHCFYY